MSVNKIDVNLVFGTPIWSYVLNNYEDVNVYLKKYIYDLKDKDPLGEKKSNKEGWHSKLFNLNDKVPQKFLKDISPCIGAACKDMDWKMESNEVRYTGMWTIINKKGASNDIHTHPNNFLSGAYYVKAPANCGNIVFHDPRPVPRFRYAITNKPNLFNSSEYSITPQDGLLVLFPSYLEHSVWANESDEERIVISFNINLFNNVLY